MSKIQATPHCIQTQAANRKNEVGNRYGRLVVSEFAGRDKYRQAIWKCTCDCGTVLMVRGSELRKGKSKGCGCFRAIANQLRSRHGHASRGKQTTEYRAWCSIVRRCTNESGADYEDYGGRGIEVCDSWRASFETFLEDMGYRPLGATSIGRIDNDGPYCKTNCRWENSFQQARNKRNNRYVVIDGKRKLLQDWCVIYGISTVAVYKRIRNGMTAHDAITRKKRCV